MSQVFYSPLQTIAVVRVKLDQGESEENIMEYLDIEDDVIYENQSVIN